MNYSYSVFLHSDHMSLYLKPFAYICISTNGSCITMQLKALVLQPLATVLQTLLPALVSGSQLQYLLLYYKLVHN